MWLTYSVIAVILLIAELAYFRIADKCNIIDKPNERSSHSTIVLRGGGIIFAISILVWFVWQMVLGEWGTVMDYIPFVVGLVLIAGVSFWDDVKSLPDSVRLVVQFLSIGLAVWCMFQGAELMALEWYWLMLIGFAALIVFVAATNFINFMDGINGITAGYSLAVLIPLLLLDLSSRPNGVSGEISRDFSTTLEMTNSTVEMTDVAGFIEPSYLIVAIIGVLVFSIFNFRPKGKAKCFAGDVGSVGIAFIMLFAIGKLIVKTGDPSYLLLLMMYSVDSLLTIGHRIMLHENLGEAHRKHVYQLMCNELKIGHVKVSLFYMFMQLAISLGFIYLIPNTVAAHWIYFVAVSVVMATAYILFKMKYYHLHEEYLASLKK